MSQLRRPPDPPFPVKIRKRLKMAVKNVGYASKIHDLRLRGKHPLRLLGTPENLWPGSLAAGSHILSGYFFHDGQYLKNPDDKKGVWTGVTIWQNTTISRHWQHHLHSFGWLADLDRVVDRRAAREKAIDLVRHWLELYDHWHNLVWAPHIIGQRVINWLIFAPLIMSSNDLVYRSKLLNSLARQARHLYLTCEEEPPGLPKIQAICGLALTGLYIPNGEKWLKKAKGLLDKALVQGCPNGEVSSRNPQDIYSLARLLITVRTSFITMDYEFPAKLDPTINALIQQLKDLSHGDGKLCLFNGSSELTKNELAATFKFGHGENLPKTSSFKRLEQGSTIIIMDAGLPAESDVSQYCHGGTLSFEMSSGAQRIIVNCGAASPYGDGELHLLSRATAAHSTLILNDKNSSEIGKDGRISRAAVRITSQISRDKGHCLLEASHDGYVSTFGLLHRRNIYLNDLGDDIRGEDILQKKGKSRFKSLKYDVRFHMHPDVTATLQGGSNQLLLRLPNAEYWQFQCRGGEMTLEESLYFGQRSRLQNCRQITLSGDVNGKETVIKWSLRRLEHGS